MKKSLQERTPFPTIYEEAVGVRVGKITAIDDSRLILVDFPGNSQGPVAARMTASAKSRMALTENAVGREVLLVFENDDPGLPIIVDTLYSLVDEMAEPHPPVEEAKKSEEVLVDGERVVFDARKEIVLRCGRSSITLTRAGKVLIKGTYVLSRSTGANHIKGGSVQIN